MRKTRKEVDQGTASGERNAVNEVDEGAALSAQDAVVGVDENLGSQSCWDIDATKRKPDVGTRVGDEAADTELSSGIA